jgi:hypothetical protein
MPDERLVPSIDDDAALSNVSAASAYRDESQRVIDVDLAVAARKRVVRGVTPAAWLTAFTAGILVFTVAGLVAADVDFMDAPMARLLVWCVVIAAGVFAFRVARTLRTGARTAAKIVAATVVLVLVGGALIVLVSLTGPDPPAGDSPLAVASGFVAGVGQSMIRNFSSEYGGVDPIMTLPLLIVMAWFVNASTVGHRLRTYMSRLPGSGIVRWSVMLFVSILLLALPMSLTNELLRVGAPVEAVGVLTALPLVVLAGVSAFEVLHPRVVGDLPPAWEPKSVERRRWGWTGRGTVVVIGLLVLAVAAIPASFLLGLLRQVLVTLLATSNETSDRGLLQVMNLMLWSVQLLFLLGALQLYTLARRRAALDATAVRANDTRPWFLYLRSFADDDIRVFAHGSPRRSLLQTLAQRRRERFEVVLAWHLWRFGPVVGVGQPRERLPRLGAAREYLDDIKWQAEVEQRISAARGIVVVLGRTEGLAWELETIERLGAMQRTIVVVPPLGREEIARRWEAFDQVAERAGWPPVPADVRQRALVAVAAANSATQNPPDHSHGAAGSSSWSGFAGRDPDEWHYEVAIEAACRSLERQNTVAASAIAQPVAPRSSSSRRLGRVTWRGVLPYLAAIAYLTGITAIGSSGQTAIVNELLPGTCINEFDPDLVEEQPHLANRVEVVSCNDMHSLEVYGNESVDLVVGSDTFPGDNDMSVLAEDYCLEMFEDYVGTSYTDSVLGVYYWSPTRETWLLGDDHVVCSVYDPQGPIAHSLRNGRR